MSDKPLNLTRNQLGEFLPNQRAIRAFEQLLKQINTLVPSDVATLYRLVEEAYIEATSGSAAANEALSSLDRVARALELLALRPTSIEHTFLKGDYLDFPVDGPHVTQERRLQWNDFDGTLDIALKGGNVVLQVGQEQNQYVRNNTAALLPNGSMVRVTGSVGQRTTVDYAQADSDANSATTIGMLTEDIAKNALGFVTTEGIVHGINTSAFAEGDVLYLSPTTPGGLTNTKPVAPSHMILAGYCLKSHPTDGHILIKIQNGYELGELHDVLITGAPLAGSLLIYDATVGVWKNARLTAGTNVTVTNADGSITLSVSGAAPTGAAGGVLSGTYPNPGFAVDMATQAELDTHTTNTSNPHSTTKTQVGLSNVTNDAQLKIASNLADLANTATARSNLGLGSAAAMAGPAGTIVGTTDTQDLTNKTYNVVNAATYNDNLAHTIAGFNNSWGTIIIESTAGKTFLPYFANGGSGAAYAFSLFDPDAGTFAYGAGPTVSFTQAGTGGNTFSVSIAGGTGVMSIQRTAGALSYTVKQQILGF